MRPCFYIYHPILHSFWRRVNYFFFFFQAEDGIRDSSVTGVQTCALPISTYCEAATLPARGERVRPVIQNGLLYRLRSPRAGRVAASQYVARDGSEVVVFAWGHSQQFAETQVQLPLRGLEEGAHYADSMSDVTYSGAYLAQNGLPLNMVR